LKRGIIKMNFNDLAANYIKAGDTVLRKNLTGGYVALEVKSAGEHHSKLFDKTYYALTFTDGTFLEVPKPHNTLILTHQKES